MRYSPPVGAELAALARLAAIVVAIASFAPSVASAARPPGEEPQALERARIGLVLSGGGARGLAHIGVIKWFEDHRIPIDFIAGTSMGGLVGGIYASGANTTQMRELLDSIDWAFVLGADTPYPQKAFRRKQDARDAPASLELGLRDGFKLPPGLDAGHQVGLLLDRIAFPYAGLDSFDQMPTPFACVAVDLESGDDVVFQEGSLAEALRSTMSYPGWFSPVVSDGRVMVDGGVLNNLPTDVMADMGADVIIAVDLGMIASEQAPFDSLLGVLNRTLSVMMRDNTERNAALADILITPDVSAFGFADFDRAADLEQIGYEASETLGREIAAFAVDEAEWAAYLDDRASRRRSFASVPEFIEVEGAVGSDDATVRATLAHHIGRDLDPDELDFDLTNITGWGRYDVVGYRGDERGGVPGLGIDVHQKTFGPPFIRPILDLRGSEFGEALITFGGRFTFYDLAGVNSEWRLDAVYGQRTQLRSELFMPVGNGGFFVAPRAIAGLSKEPLYEEGNAVAEYEVGRVGVGGDLGYLFGPRSQLRFGANVEFQDAEVDIGDALFPPVKGTVGEVVAAWQFDGANSAVIPTAGVRVELDGRWIFASPEVDIGGGAIEAEQQKRPHYYQSQLGIVGARHLGGRFSFLGSLSGGTSFNATAAPLQRYVLGGPLRLGGLHVDELRGSHFFLGRAGLLWALADESQLSFFGKFYLAAFYEVGDAFESKADPFQDLTFGLAGETMLGGVFVGGAIGEEGRGGFFFAVGRLF